MGQPYPGVDFNTLLAVTGDPAFTGYGVHWSVSSGRLPAGLTLSKTGVLSGVPSASGTAGFEVSATYDLKTGQASFSIPVTVLTVNLATATPPQALVGQPYSYDLRQMLSVSGDPGYVGSGVSWSVVSSSLPAGLQLNTDGTISGTPTSSGTGALTARATYRGVNGQQTYQVVTLNIGVVLAAATPPQAIVGQAYSYDLKSLLSVTGDSAYTGSGAAWSVVSSSLPAGLQLNTDGTISGIPTASGTGAITARATYRGVNGQQSYQVVTLNIGVALAAATPPQAIVGQAYSFDLKSLLSVTGDSAYTGAEVTWSVVSSSLPAGLQLRVDGTISGTPTGSGTGSMTARATYRGVNGQQTYQVVTLNVGVVLATATPPQAIVGQAYSYDLKSLLSVTGDSAYTGSGVTWSVVSSSLPAGLQLNTDGTISGTPTASGTGALTARATYRSVNGQQTYQVVTLNIGVALAAATPPQAIVGQAYSYDLKSLLSVTGDAAYTNAAVTWSVVTGSLPAGLSLSSSGIISGVPTGAASTSATVQATYKGVSGQHQYSVQSLAITISLANAALPAGMVSNAYAYDFKQNLAVTGDSSYASTAAVFSASGQVPAGLALGSNGVLSGTPTAVVANGVFAVTASYRGVTATSNYALSVNPAVYTFSPTLSGSTANYNVYNAAKAAGWDGVRPLSATITIPAGSTVGATATGVYAFATGAGFPTGSTIALLNSGSILGAGGSAGANGGPALSAQYALAITNSGTISGGGGGGGTGGYGGTGGAGGSCSVSTPVSYSSSGYADVWSGTQSAPQSRTSLQIGGGSYSSYPAGWYQGGLVGKSCINPSHCSWTYAVSTNVVTYGYGGAGGSGGSGGAGGQGAGYNQGATGGLAGSGGYGGSVGSGPGCTWGGTGGQGGTGSAGAGLGTTAGAGYTGATGSPGTNGGAAGAGGSPGAGGGAAGYAVVGNAYVTWRATGTVLGPQQ